MIFASFLRKSNPFTLATHFWNCLTASEHHICLPRTQLGIILRKRANRFYFPPFLLCAIFICWLFYFPSFFGTLFFSPPSLGASKNYLLHNRKEKEFFVSSRSEEEVKGEKKFATVLVSLKATGCIKGALCCLSIALLTMGVDSELISWVVYDYNLSRHK